MRNFNLTPLWRSTVGFDRLLDDSLRPERSQNRWPTGLPRAARPGVGNPL